MSDESRIERLAVIGAGKMGETLISALIGTGVLTPEALVATAKHDQRLRYMKPEYGVATTLDNRLAAAGADLILLCVKP